MSARACRGCECVGDSPAHALVAALADDDLDLAIDRGLLGAIPCPACSESCMSRLIAARDERRAALAARERFRARAARLMRRAAEKRAPATTPPEPSAAGRTPLPAAAADALARAMARAKGRA